MIDFACKRITKEDVLRCSFSLNKTEYTALLFLLKKSGSIKQISLETNLDRTTIQKALKQLLEKQIIIRKRDNKKGASYFYCLKNKSDFKKEINSRLNLWYNSVKKEIERI
jgi:predicted transcriptional regulator